jgi:hypothetical protein
MDTHCKREQKGDQTTIVQIHSKIINMQNYYAPHLTSIVFSDSVFMKRLLQHVCASIGRKGETICYKSVDEVLMRVVI